MRASGRASHAPTACWIVARSMTAGPLRGRSHSSGATVNDWALAVADAASANQARNKVLTLLRIPLGGRFRIGNQRAAPADSCSLWPRLVSFRSSRLALEARDGGFGPRTGDSVFVRYELIERILEYLLREKGRHAGNRAADQRAGDRNAVGHARRDPHPQLLRLPREVDIARHDDARRRT